MASKSTPLKYYIDDQLSFSQNLERFTTSHESQKAELKKLHDLLASGTVREPSALLNLADIAVKISGNIEKQGFIIEELMKRIEENEILIEKIEEEERRVELAEGGGKNSRGLEERENELDLLKSELEEKRVFKMAMERSWGGREN